MYKLDRVDKECLWLVGFDHVRVKSVYSAILFGSSTHRNVELARPVVINDRKANDMRN